MIQNVNSKHKFMTEVMVEDLTPIYTAIAVLLSVLSGIIIANYHSGKNTKEHNVIIANQEKIKATLNKRDVSSSFNKIIEVNEGIINNLGNISKYVREGDILFLIGKSSVYDVTLIENDNLELNGDFTFETSRDMIQLVYISGKWKEITRTDCP